MNARKHLPAIVLTAVMLAAALNSPAARAENLRVATVDVNKILNSLPESKRKKAELDKLQAGAKQQIEKKKAAVKALEEKAKKEGSRDEGDATEELRTAIKDYERSVSDAQEDLKREFLKVNRDLTQRVMQAVERYAKDHDLELVLDKGAQGVSPVLYGDAAADITDEVLKSMGG